MNNRQVFTAFASGASAHGGSVRSEPVSQGAILYSYATPIAYYRDHVAAFDERKYSVTTSKQVSQAKSACANRGLRVEVLPHDEFRERVALMGAYLGGAR